MVRYDLAVATNYPVAPMNSPADNVERPSLTNHAMANIANAEKKRANKSADYRNGYAAGYASGVAAAKRRARTDAA